MLIFDDILPFVKKKRKNEILTLNYNNIKINILHFNNT